MLKNISSKTCINGLNSKVCAVLGAQWGDEGKGKLIDTLSDKYDIVARFNGGANAGHTIKVGNDKYFFHVIPSGILRPNAINIIGNGCVLDPFGFLKELHQVEEKKIDWKNRLFISDKVHLTLKGHYEIEKDLEESKLIRIETRNHKKSNRNYICIKSSQSQSQISRFA